MNFNKLKDVINSCTTNRQLLTAEIYAELFLGQYIHPSNINTIDDDMILNYISNMLTDKSTDICNKTNLEMSLQFKIFRTINTTQAPVQKFNTKLASYTSDRKVKKLLEEENNG